MDTFLDRLKFLWPHGAKPSDIYNKIEMSASGFNRVWKEGAIPTADYLVKIQEVTGCDLNWLLTGKGLPYLDKAKPENAGAFSVSRNSDGITDTMGNRRPVRVCIRAALQRSRSSRVWRTSLRRRTFILLGFPEILD